MVRNRLGTSLVLAAALTGAAAGTTHAACQIPLAIGANTGNANVLILMDNSGSMNEALVPSVYNPNTNWSGRFSSGSTYNVSTSGTFSPKSFNSGWPSTPTAYLVASDVGEAGQYNGNYLNWVFFNATAAQRAAIPVVTRIQAAKATINSFIAGIADCRLGLEQFNPNSNIDGGVILANIGSSVATIQAQVTATHAQTYTPLGESMVTAMNYFSQTGANAPIQAPCQKNFVVVVTDGLPTRDTNFPSYIHDNNHDGYYLDDVATYMYRNDLRPDMDGIQNVSTYTIGFNVDDGSLLQLTADGGGGEYYSINDAAGLEDALTSAFNSIAARVAAGAAVSVVSSEDRTSNRLYRARYESQTWKGYLEAYNLPYHSGAASLWDAGALLAARSASSRTIYTSVGGSLTGLTAANAATLRTYFGAPDVATATNIITYTRGDSVSGTRNRGGWKLGDIVDAAPIMVGKPTAYSDLAGYATYRAAQASRREVVYAAANDGMLHCFDATDGSELWGYVPADLLPSLSQLMDPSYCHEYLLNMSPAAYDLYLNGAWKTVLVGGEAQGGDGLFALDVTDPTTPRVMWDLSISGLKGAWSAPTVVRDRQLGTQVFCIGTGYDANSAQTNLLVIDPATGSVLRTLALGTPVAGNKTTKATAFDRDLDGYEDVLYMGDLAGNLWKVDLTTSPWTPSKLFAGSQPIQAAPTVTTDELSRPMIFFGTGQFMLPNDVSSNTQQAIYGIVDDGTSTVLTSANLMNQTTNITPLGTGSRGWFVNLPNSGERVIHNSALIAGTLYVPSFAPTATACTGGGQSWLYSFDYSEGSAPRHSNGTSNHTTVGRSQSMGDGIISDPSVDLVNSQLILQSSNAVLLTHDISIGLQKLLVRSWKQKWN